MEITKEHLYRIVEKYNINTENFPIRSLRHAMEIETEHLNLTGNDIFKIAKIVIVHLNDFPDYYARLSRMRKAAHKYWENRKKLNIYNDKINEESDEEFENRIEIKNENKKLDDNEELDDDELKKENNNNINL